MAILRLGLIVTLVLLLMLAAGRSIQMARADLRYREGTSASVRSAIALEPDNALYSTGLGDLQAAAGEDPLPSFRRAAELKPDDAFIRVRLGLAAEAEGRLEEAELHLLAAAAASRKYEPRWTLANFYFRRSSEEEFWLWAREALQMSFGDRTALFDLCWRLDSTGQRLAAAVPDDGGVQMAYAEFLIRQESWDLAEGILAKRAASATPAVAPRFLASVDRLIGARRIDGAVDVWNALSAGGATPYAQLNRQRGPWLDNGNFAKPVLGAGFDWRFHRQPGVYTSRRRPEGLRIELSGRQPNECDILHRYIPVEGGGAYDLQYEFDLSASGFAAAPAQSGLLWRATDLAGNTLIESAPMTAAGAGAGALSFRIPVGEGCVQLVLAHRRAPGAVRMEGTVNLEHVKLTFQGPILQE